MSNDHAEFDKFAEEIADNHLEIEGLNTLQFDDIVEDFMGALIKKFEEPARRAAINLAADALAGVDQNARCVINWSKEGMEIEVTFEGWTLPLKFDAMEELEDHLGGGFERSPEEFASLDKTIALLQRIRADWEAQRDEGK